MSDFRPTADWAVLKHRAVMLRRTREFFDARGFIEVETPILSADTVIDRHLDPPVVENIGCLNEKPGSPRRMFLQTSPEFAMKRLLAAGAGAMYQIAHAFRFGERGPRHNPEFTIVEWYRPGDDYAAGIKLLGELCQTLLGRAVKGCLSYREAFQRYVEIDPHAAPLSELIAVAEARTPQGAAALQGVTDRDAWLDLLLVELIEPHLGRPHPIVLNDYPASQAALARLRDGDPPVAERFELYCDGVELANGYHELLDAETLARRNIENNRLRVGDGKPPLPEQSRLVEAMRHGLPACTGCALGFDRVVMLACGKTRIEEVLPFPIERA